MRAVIDIFARLKHRPNIFYRGTRPMEKGWPNDLGLRDVILN
jgi:hypothetical protein